MRKILQIALCLLIALSLSCEKDDEVTMTETTVPDVEVVVDTPDEAEEEEEEQEPETLVLPDATQTGAGTFGCVIDGEVYTEDDDLYITSYSLIDGSYYFNEGAFRDDRDVFFVGIASLGVAMMEEGVTYTLNAAINGAYYGEIGLTENTAYNTTGPMAGELTITRLDTENKIISGTFWYDVENPNTGDIIEIREGRFDKIYED